MCVRGVWVVCVCVLELVWEDVGLSDVLRKLVICTRIKDSI